MVHGQLSWHANGRPYLTPAGTEQVVGFPRQVRGLSAWLPAAVTPGSPVSAYARLAPLKTDRIDLVGDFEVCPVTPSSARVMQLACMERAWNLVAQPNSKDDTAP